MPANTHYPLSDAVENFILARRSEGTTENTQLFYRDRLAHLVRAFSDLRELTPDSLRRFILQYSETHNGGGTHGLFRALRAFLRWVDSEGLVTDWLNPITKIKPPRIDRVAVIGVSSADVRKLADGATVRDYAIVLSLYDGGMRAREFLSLTRSDIDFSTGRVSIHKAKSRRGRVTFFSPASLKAIKEYLATRTDDKPELWITDELTPLQYEGLRHVIKRRARAAGIAAPKLHSFRHGFALAFVRAGGNVFSLQKLLGHSDLETTKLYVSLQEDDLAQSHKQFSPVGRMAAI